MLTYVFSRIQQAFQRLYEKRILCKNERGLIRRIFSYNIIYHITELPQCYVQA
jgi:hypothetical protein